MVNPAIKHAFEVIDAQMSKGYPAQSLEDWQIMYQYCQHWIQRLEEVREDTECFITNEMALGRLLDLEEKLAERLHLSMPIRDQLIALDRKNLLIEDELVADWHQAYAWYLESRND